MEIKRKLTQKETRDLKKTKDLLYDLLFKWTDSYVQKTYKVNNVEDLIKLVNENKIKLKKDDIEQIKYLQADL